MTLPLITTVWRALGGPGLRHGRGPAWWRGGDGYHVALDEERGCWYDFSRGEGGGVLSLIERVLGCDRKAAYHWVAERFSLPIASAEERRTHAAQLACAQAIATHLTTWRAQLVTRLIHLRNAYHDADRAVCDWAVRNLHHRHLVSDTALWDEIYRETLLYQQRAAECEVLVAIVERMKPRELLALQRRHGEFEACRIADTVNHYLHGLQLQLEHAAAAEREVA